MQTNNNIMQGNEQQKIIVVAPAYPYRGGQALDEAYLYHIISSLGYDYQCISYTLLYPKIFFPGKTQYDSSKIIPYPHNERIQRLLSSINPFTWIKTYRYIKKEKPQMVIFLWWMFFFGPCIGIVSWLIRHYVPSTKVCILADNYVSHENHFWERLIIKKTFSQAQYFIAPSKYIESEIHKDFPTKPICTTTLSVYDCYNLHRYDQNSARTLLGLNTKEVLLFFGLIRPYKGLDKLLEAFSLIKKQRKDITLLIVGECYEDIKRYTDLINKYHISDSVKLVNKFVENEAIEPYFAACDVVVLPYYSATQSGVVMTAYAFEKPVVVTNVGGIHEEIDQKRTGVIIDNNSPENIISGVNFVLDNIGKIDYEANIRIFKDKFGNQTLKEFLKNI